MRKKASTKWIRIVAVLLLTVAPCFATHPQLLMDSAELNFMRSKVAANTTDWQALHSTCDVLAAASVRWPASVGSTSDSHRISPNNATHPGYIIGSSSSSTIIYIGEYGSGFYSAITKLGACYLALKATNPGAASPYLAQAHNIITAISQPLLTLTRKRDGAVRYGLSVDAYGNDLKAGAVVSVYVYPPNGLKVGDVWTVTGAQGCTSINGIWLLTSVTGNTVQFANTNGSAAPKLNANCTLYSVEPNSGSSYGMRYMVPAMAIAYDWFYDGLSSKEKSNLITAINQWVSEVKTRGYGQAHPESNYYAAYLWGIVAADISTDGDNPTMSTWFSKEIDSKFTAPHMLRDYQNLWLAGGGNGEGWTAYGFESNRFMMNAALAMKIHGTDWTQSPYNFSFVDDTLRYWMQFTTPSKLELDDNEFIYPEGATEAGITAPVHIPLGDAAMYSAAGRRFGSVYTLVFQDWYNTVYAKKYAAAGKGVPGWSKGAYTSQPPPDDYFLYYDPDAGSRPWTSLPLMYRAWGGNYAVTRSDWSDTAVEVTLLGGPTVGNAGNGKTQFNSGAVTIQRGSDHILVYGLSEGSRAYDLISHAVWYNTLYPERATFGNKKNSIFWAGTNLAETKNQGYYSRKVPPGHTCSVTTWGSSIDRAEDTSSYTYWRASGLEANNNKSGIDGKYHQTAWTREVFFLRPKLIVVHDRTTVLNNSDDRAMFWNFGRNVLPVTGGVPQGVSRLDLCTTQHNPPLEGDNCDGSYRGAFWSILPASPSTVSVVDHDGLHFLYRVEVRPAANDHRSDTWLSVVDAVDSPKSVNTVTPVLATNADAVQFNDTNHTAIAFPKSYPPVLPITLALSGAAHVSVAGLGPSTKYKVTIDNAHVIIDLDDGTGRITSSSAGVLEFSPQ